MKKICVLACAMASLFSAPVWANEAGKSDTGLDYNYLGVDYASYTISSTSGYAGYKVNGSVLVNQNIYLLANYFNVDKSSTVYEKSNIGLGYRIECWVICDLKTIVCITYVSVIECS